MCDRFYKGTAALLLSVFLLLSDAWADRHVLLDHAIKLRSGVGSEWSNFAATETEPKDSLTLEFHASLQNPPRTLGLLRHDVKEDWQIRLNGAKVADLFSDETACAKPSQSQRKP